MKRFAQQFPKNRLMQRSGLAFCLLLGLATTARPQTLVSGNIFGTWTPANNPYIAVADCTVPAGETLTIQPGVILMIASNVSITADGSLIKAVGTPSQRITIQAAGSVYWNTISLVNAPGVNQFHYCDFQNADTALSLTEVDSYTPMVTEILNCTFSNCLSQAIAVGSNGALQEPVIKNNSFKNTPYGCVMWTGWYWVWTPGYVNPVIIGNIFQNLNGAAFVMLVSAGSGYSTANFINNTVINCNAGVDATDPWDATVQDNIFVGCTNAVRVSGSLSRTVSYNDFYNNATNFTGYPGQYGMVIWNNRNGTPADVLYNIFQNPLFVGSSDYHLTSGSPCIDAGTPDWAFTDMCFPPAQGKSFPDLGAYGGPDGCNWSNDVPVLLADLQSITVSNNSIWLSWGAVPRSSYQIQYSVTGLGSNDWANLDNGLVLAADKPTSFPLWSYPSADDHVFFRIQSLGRTPGN